VGFVVNPVTCAGSEPCTFTYWPSTQEKADLTVSAPPATPNAGRGVVQRAWMSLPNRIRPISRVASTKGLQANYLFSIEPAVGSRLRVSWFRNGVLQFTVAKERRKRVTSAIFSGAGLSPGSYRAVLSVRAPGRRYVAVATARAHIG
jgi:hypothetical protein